MLLDHEELIQKLAKAAALAGWQMTYQKKMSRHVSRLTFSKGEEWQNVLAYLWNLKSRSDNHGNRELYVKSNNGVPIRQLEGEKTLLIGYEPSTECFVGWDARQNSCTSIVASPSLMVSKEHFSQAYPDGLAFHSLNENEVAVIFRPDALMNYICNLKYFHAVVSEPEQNILMHISQSEGRLEEARLQSLPTDRQVAVKAIARHWAETHFRRCVLAAYRNRCAMCGCQPDFRVDVEAVYIVPAGHPEFESETSNGLCLCALHHRAFDQGLVAVLPDYKIVINRTKLILLQSQSLNGGEEVFVKNLQMQISTPQQLGDRPNASLVRTALHIRELQNDALEPVPSVTGE